MVASSTWSESNQKYLSASIEEIKILLERYKDSEDKNHDYSKRGI